jgi:hypothetical protein
MFQLDYLFCLNLLLSVNNKSYVNVVPLTYVILIRLLSFDMSDCTHAAMDEINNNNNNNNSFTVLISCTADVITPFCTVVYSMNISFAAVQHLLT